MKGDARDPSGLIAESFRIEGITQAECRNIFLDWALKLPVQQDSQSVIPELLERHADQPDNHPMIQTLREGLARAPRPGRRGGRAGRMS
ncbi:hypothetical protein SAMN05428995_103134 [Loktanella sp. DSM 29012]|uniref:Uncharacterized protein n=1 Tax=Loktanella gaetbuli TaxID=2881335 RepID=A0ABS8BQ75_9RHOB|nr:MULTISPECIES: hypothetical protein [Loktanella]MCB5197873.1 hypothetical protein [Loktanella gaetbuli]SEQ18155.1 hypothetical protein SAMN05428995_103134 [Loktanella sp. DSM 29012]